MSLTKVTFSMIEGSPRNVLDYGADPTGVQDSTLAFNQALNFDVVITANTDNGIRQVVFVPPGNYLLNGTVFIQKGMHLKGSIGARITVPVLANATPTFAMGYGLYSGVKTPSGGGLPPALSDLATEGGSTTAPLVEAHTSGIQLYNMFITSAPIGVDCNCGELNLFGSTFDLCATAIRVDATGILVASSIVGCSFFACASFAFGITGPVFDVVVSSCTFNTSKINDVAIQSSANTVKNLTFNACTFFYNQQFVTITASQFIQTSGADVTYVGCTWRNNPAPAIFVLSSTLNNSINIKSCVFDGLKTNPLFPQSTNSSAITLIGDNHTVNISGNSFANQTATECISINDLQSSVVNFVGNIWGNNSSSFLITCSNSLVATRLNLTGNQGDSITPLINTSATAITKIKNNTNWFGPLISSGGKLGILLPTCFGVSAVIGIGCNTLGGVIEYFKSGVYVVTRTSDDVMGVLTDTMNITTLEASTAGTAPAIAPNIYLDSIGGPTTANYVRSRNIVFAVPDSYEVIYLTVDYVG